MAAPRVRKPDASNSRIPTAIYRLMVDSIPQIVWTAQADGRIDYVNQRAVEYAGKQSAAMTIGDWLLLVHPQDRRYCVARWAQAVKAGVPYENQYRLRRADGEYRWHLALARPLKDHSGRVMKWFGTCTDIEEQMRASQVLARRRGEPKARITDSERKLRSIMTLTSDFFWETDKEHRFSVLEPGGRFNQVMSVSTSMGKTRWDVPSVLPDAEGWRAHRETLDARRAFRDFETARVRDDGMVHHYAIDGEPVFDARGEFLGYRGVGREITARKLSEQALREGDQRFRSFLDSVPAIAWIKDSQLRYVWVSASYERILGKSLDAIRGRDDFAIWPAAKAEHFRRNDEKVLRANSAVQDVAHTLLPDGGMGRWMAVKFPLPDATGALGVVGIAFDITENNDEAGAVGADDSPLVRLSGRELQVLHLVVDGHTSAEVGERLGLSPKSVDTYRSRLMAKLGFTDLPSLVKFALRHGLTTKR